MKPRQYYLHMHLLPRDQDFPADAIQCHGCGGHGCGICGRRGWLPKDHPRGRHCARDGCDNPIPPFYGAIYCSTRCAMMDA